MKQWVLWQKDGSTKENLSTVLIEWYQQNSADQKLSRAASKQCMCCINRKSMERGTEAAGRRWNHPTQFCNHRLSSGCPTGKNLPKDLLGTVTTRTTCTYAGTHIHIAFTDKTKDPSALLWSKFWKGVMGSEWRAPATGLLHSAWESRAWLTLKPKTERRTMNRHGDNKAKDKLESLVWKLKILVYCPYKNCSAMARDSSVCERMPWNKSRTEFRSSEYWSARPANQQALDSSEKPFPTASTEKVVNNWGRYLWHAHAHTHAHTCAHTQHRTTHLYNLKMNNHTVLKSNSSQGHTYLIVSHLQYH